jgi:hypothetical protein
MCAAIGVSVSAMALAPGVTMNPGDTETHGSSSTSAIVAAVGSGRIADVALAWGSRSTTRVRIRRCIAAPARPRTTVVLPTPPLRLSTATTCTSTTYRRAATTDLSGLFAGVHLPALRRHQRKAWTDEESRLVLESARTDDDRPFGVLAGAGVRDRVVAPGPVSQVSGGTSTGQPPAMSRSLTRAMSASLGSS